MSANGQNGRESDGADSLGSVTCGSRLEAGLSGERLGGDEGISSVVR